METCQHCLRESETKCTRMECLEQARLEEEAKALGRHGTCRRCRLPQVISSIHDPKCTYHPRNRAGY